jgi:hypothetical protein
MIISRWILPRARNVSEKKNCRENKNTHLKSNKFIFEIRTVYEIMWQNMVEPDVAENTQFSCGIIDAKILYFFPRPQWLRERASLLRCTCTSRFAELSRCVWRYKPMYLLVKSVYNYVTIRRYTYNYFFYKGYIRFLALAPWIVRLFNFFVPLCLLCL